MDQKQPRNLRLYILAGLFLAVMAVFLGVLYDTQVNDYETYYASSVRSIARSEPVEAARGNITDRNGKVLVSSRSSYNLTFDASLLDDGEDANEAILRLLQLCQSRGISWADYLPITRTSPFSYQLDSLGSTDKGRFLTYLKSLDEAADALGDYLLAHPSLLETVDEDGDRSNPADDILEDERLDTDRKKADALLEKLTSDQLTDTLLTRSGLSATRLIAQMQEDFGLSLPAERRRLRRRQDHPLLRPGVRDDLRGAYPGVSGQHRQPGGEGGPGRGLRLGRLCGKVRCGGCL